MEIILSWHRFIVRHFVKANIILLLMSLFFLFDLRNLAFDGDWLNLFSKNDPEYSNYRRLVTDDKAASPVFIKLTDYSRGRLHSLRADMKRIEGVSSVEIMDLNDGGSGEKWMEIGVQSRVGFSAPEKSNTVKLIENRLQDAGAEYGITGAIPILKEYTKSVKTDFIKTSFIAVALIILTIIYFFGFSLSVIFGFMYQGMGLLAAMFFFRQVYGPINSLAAMMPCVLIGLGIDFVIHSIVTVESSSAENNRFLGEVIYRKVSIPVFWGALTTVLAFLSLLFADLKGLHSAGALGALSIMGMFAFVILFLPAAVTRFHNRDRNRKLRMDITFPFIDNKKALGAIILITVCAALGSFAGNVRFEEKIENLYTKDMASFRLQDELSEKLGVYPSKLYVSFETANPKKDLQKLSLGAEVFIPDPKSVRINPISGSHNSEVILQIFPRKNPFSPKVFETVHSEFDKVFGPLARKTVHISGDAVLYRHLTNLLIKGMTIAFFAVFIFLALVLLVVFRNICFALSALTVLFVSTLATLGGFGLFSISLSAYTITLFPLFIGIGVDDCLHVLYLKRKGGRLVSGSFVLNAITLTTITTVLCYGSLITAKNAGFDSVGKAAVLGLGLMFLCAVYLLPVLLGGNSKRNIIIPLITLVILCSPASVFSKEEFAYPIIPESMKQAGAVAYSHKEGYSKGISDMYLGYDEDGKIVAGAASRKIYTYKKLMSFLTVKVEDNSYIVNNVYIPDINKIKKQKKRNKVLSSIKGILGKVLIDRKGKYHVIDAVTGATRYHKRIYANYNFLSKKIIEEMKNNPDWQKQPLP